MLWVSWNSHKLQEETLCCHTFYFVCGPVFFDVFFREAFVNWAAVVRLGKKVANLKVICCPTFAQTTSREASWSHSIIWLPPNLFSLFVSKNVSNRYNFNYVDKVDTSFQFIGRSFSNEGLKIVSILANFCNGSLFSQIITLSWFPETFSTCHSVKDSWKLSSFLYFENFCVFICYGLALSSRIYTIFEQPSLEQFNLSNS